MSRRTSEPGMLGLGRSTPKPSVVHLRGAPNERNMPSNNAVILLCSYLCTDQRADFRMDARSRHSVVMPPNQKDGMWRKNVREWNVSQTVCAVWCESDCGRMVRASVGPLCPECMVLRRLRISV